MATTTLTAGRRWRNRPLVREHDAAHSRWLIRVVLALVLITAPAAAYLIWQNESLKLSYELNTLKTKQETLLEEERRLKVERARLAALPRVESWALRDRGLVRPEGEAVVTVLPTTAAPTEVVARGDAGRFAGSSRTAE